MAHAQQRQILVQPEDTNLRLIPLTKGQHAVVDAHNYDRLMRRNWHAMFVRGCFYAVARSRKVDGFQPRISILMHREVLGIHPKDERHVDHRESGKTLLNTEANLRPCTQSQNQGNRIINRNNKSGLKGVFPARQNGRYIASIGVSGVVKYLGTFDTKEQAHAAYMIEAIRRFGEFARAN